MLMYISEDWPDPPTPSLPTMKYQDKLGDKMNNKLEIESIQFVAVVGNTVKQPSNRLLHSNRKFDKLVQSTFENSGNKGFWRSQSSEAGWSLTKNKLSSTRLKIKIIFLKSCIASSTQTVILHICWIDLQIKIHFGVN